MSDTTVTALVGGSIHTGDQVIDGKALLLQGERVQGIVALTEIPAAARQLDIGGHVLAPGFIDLQINGGGGVLFGADPAADGIARIAAAHAAFGVTSWLPTLITSSTAAMAAARAAVVRSLQGGGQDGILGIHFEGPWLNPARKGVHPPAWLRRPAAADIDLLAPGEGAVTLVTLAPEQVAAGFIAGLRRRGIRIAAGHTEADEAHLAAARAEGLDLYTHLFNAMTPPQARAPGVVGAALADPEAYCSIIVDGFHVHYANVAIAWRCKPPGRLLLVSDAMPPVGSADESFLLDGAPVLVRGGRCTTADGTLAGSAVGLATAVANCVRHVGIPLAEALRMASTYVADYLGLGDRLGRIRPGYRADLVVLDAGLRTVATFRRGMPIFGAPWA